MDDILKENMILAAKLKSAEDHILSLKQTVSDLKRENYAMKEGKPLSVLYGVPYNIAVSIVSKHHSDLGRLYNLEN